MILIPITKMAQEDKYIKQKRRGHYVVIIINNIVIKKWNRLRNIFEFL